MCPIGYESTPTDPLNAFKSVNDIKSSKQTTFVNTKSPSNGSENVGALTPVTTEPFEDFVIVGEISFRFPVFHVFKWEDIQTDLNQQYPKFYDIRRVEQGIQEKPKADQVKKKIGTNTHCIIEFSSYTD
jgi:hypothetical protein